jgi:hypothetical protein
MCVLAWAIMTSGAVLGKGSQRFSASLGHDRQVALFLLASLVWHRIAAAPSCPARNFVSMCSRFGGVVCSAGCEHFRRSLS